MDKKVLLRLLKHRIQEIEASLNSINDSDILHEIEIDLILSKIRFFYSEAKLLSEIVPDLESDNPQSQTMKEPAGYEDSNLGAQAKDMVEVMESEDEQDNMIEILDEQEQFDEEINTTEPEPIPEPKPELIPEPEPEPEPEPKPEPEPIRELKPEVGKRIPTFGREEVHVSHEPPSPAKDSSNGNILTGVKMEGVNDIMIAIGLNDRFLFTRELFDNDAEVFTKTINTLNNKASWEEASKFMTENFDWDPEDPTHIMFLSIVKRRFL